MDFNLHRGGPQLPAQAPLILMLPGFGLVALAILLIYNRELLVWLVAGMMFFVGAILILLGRRMQRLLGK